MSHSPQSPSGMNYTFERLEERWLLSGNFKAVWAAQPSPAPALTKTSAAPAPSVSPAPYGDVASPVPGRIEAENFDNGPDGLAYHDTDAVNLGGVFRSTGVDIQATGDAGGGYNVGWTRAGEFLTYTTSVATGGTFDLAIRAASPSAGGAVHVEVDGVDVTGEMSIPATGDWQSYGTVTHSNISLSAGQHVVKLVMDAENAAGYVGNFNWLQFTPSAATTPTTPTTPTAPTAPTIPVTPAADSINGSVFNDANANGTRDPGEQGLAGQEVYLDLQGLGSFVAGDPTAFTDANGAYGFTGLNPGNYIVRLARDASRYTLTTPIPNWGGFFWVPLPAGQSVTGRDFGLQSVGPALGVSEIVDNGDAANRINIVILGDGYTAADLSTTYTADINALVNYMFGPDPATMLADPFPRYHDFFNVYRIDLASPQAGASDPSTGKQVNNALGATYSFDGTTQRLLYTDAAKTNSAFASAINGAFRPDIELVPVNDSEYGGGGGDFAVYSAHDGWGPEIALHELGHSFASLGDEYGGNPAAYPFPEPVQPNLTTDPAHAKWSGWLGYAQPGVGVIGTYPGGEGYDQGVYHPSVDSKMNHLGKPFDAIGREQIIENIYAKIRPIDRYTPNTSTLLNPSSLSVTVIDPAVLNVQWSVDGRTISANGGQNLDVQSLGLAPGAHAITATVYDPTDWVRSDRSKLQQAVSWTVAIA